MPYLHKSNENSGKQHNIFSQLLSNKEKLKGYSSVFAVPGYVTKSAVYF